MQILSTIATIIWWCWTAGIVLSIAWVLWVYCADLPSHSEMTEEEEKRMLESLKAEVFPHQRWE
jgi:hypothetical protein